MSSDELGNNSEDSPAKKQRVAQDVEDSDASVSQATAISNVQLNEQVVSQLECPVCRDTCLPPIFMCSNGHIACENCQPLLKECGVCRAPGKPTLRCVQLEKIAGLLTYPCPNKSKGCTLVLSCSEMSEHIPKCKYGLKCFKCLKCGTWKATVIDLKVHVQTMHPEISNMVSSTGCIIKRTSMRMATVRRVEVFFYNDDLFWANSYFCSEVEWDALFFQIASNDVGKASRYIYSIEFTSKNLKNNSKVFYQAEVQEMNGTVWDQIVIPAPIIDSYEDGILEYTLKISVN